MRPKILTLLDENGASSTVVQNPAENSTLDLGSYRVLSQLPDMLVLRKVTGDGLDSGQTTGRVLMAGELISESTLLDVVNVIVSARWIGVLHVHGRDAHRAFGFDRGILRHASSDSPEDRLDKILFRIGVLTPTLAESVERSVKPGQRFGEVLVDQGLIERKRLFDYLRDQVTEIFCSAVLEEHGGYLFQVADTNALSPPSVIAHIPAQQMLFRAAERLDHVKEFHRWIPTESMRPELEPGVDLTKLPPRDRLVLGYCDGTRSVREIASETWLGRFHTLQAVHGFLKNHQVRLKPADPSANELADNLVDPCNQALREIYKIVDEHGKTAELRLELEEKIAENDYSDSLDGVLTDEGFFDSRTVSSWLDELQIRDRLEVIEHTLHELTSFALFYASLTLPRAEERQLATKVNQQLLTKSERA